MVIVVLSGLDPKEPHRKVVGWTEDLIDSTEDVLIHEPLYFTDYGVAANSDTVFTNRISLEVPYNGLPDTLRISAVEDITTYEGVSDFGSLYIASVAQARKIRSKYDAKWTQRHTSAKPSTPVTTPTARI